jgi:tetratricopeptide (TPR) repeat protein
MISIAKDSIKEKMYDEAHDMLTKAVEAADLYGNVDKAAEANGLINQTLMQKANAFLNDKDYASAITVYEQIMTLDATNGNAALRLGQCHASLGNSDEAEQAFLTAAANGQEKQANKQLSNLYVKKSQASYKEKKYQEAIDFAVKSNEYLENANAYKLAGQAAFGLGNNEEALPYLEKYVELSPNAKDAIQMKYNIAATAQKLGDKEKAKAYYEQVLADPKFGPSAKQQLDALNK